MLQYIYGEYVIKMITEVGKVKSEFVWYVVLPLVCSMCLYF